jgi:hypothetical protein
VYGVVKKKALFSLVRGWQPGRRVPSLAHTALPGRSRTDFSVKTPNHEDPDFRDLFPLPPSSEIEAACLYEYMRESQRLRDELNGRGKSDQGLQCPFYPNLMLARVSLIVRRLGRSALQSPFLSNLTLSQLGVLFVALGRAGFPRPWKRLNDASKTQLVSLLAGITTGRLRGDKETYPPVIIEEGAAEFDGSSSRSPMAISQTVPSLEATDQTVGWMRRPERHTDLGGNPEGSIMGITEVKTTETPDPETTTNLALRFGIKKQPGTTIDHTKVTILAEFYDAVGDKDVKLTDADVNYEWLTPMHNWMNTNLEELSVSYLRPKTEIAGTGQRRYLGYRIRVYYDGKLEAVQAEPARLLQLFPPPASLAEKEAEYLSAASIPNPADSSQPEVSVSPFAGRADFAKYAMKLRERGLDEVPPLSEPTTLQPAIQRYPWKTNIVMTVFWIGGKANHQSA